MKAELQKALLALVDNDVEKAKKIIEDLLLVEVHNHGDTTQWNHHNAEDDMIIACGLPGKQKDQFISQVGKMIQEYAKDDDMLASHLVRKFAERDDLTIGQRVMAGVMFGRMMDKPRQQVNIIRGPEELRALLEKIKSDG